MSQPTGWYVASTPNIEAYLKDGTYQLLTPQMLDAMLERHLVSQFKRSSGWVIVGVDPVRVKREEESSCGYSGLERRVSLQTFPRAIP